MVSVLSLRLSLEVMRPSRIPSPPPPLIYSSMRSSRPLLYPFYPQAGGSFLLPSGPKILPSTGIFSLPCSSHLMMATPGCLSGTNASVGISPRTDSLSLDETSSPSRSLAQQSWLPLPFPRSSGNIALICAESRPAAGRRLFEFRLRLLLPLLRFKTARRNPAFLRKYVVTSF